MKAWNTQLFHGNELTLKAPTPLVYPLRPKSVWPSLWLSVMMDVVRYLYLIILMVMMKNLLPWTCSMAVTYVQTHTDTYTATRVVLVLCKGRHLQRLKEMGRQMHLDLMVLTLHKLLNKHYIIYKTEVAGENNHG